MGTEGGFQDVSSGNLYSDLGIIEKMRKEEFRFVNLIDEVVDEDFQKVHILLIVKKFPEWIPYGAGENPAYRPVAPYWWEVLTEAAAPLRIGVHPIYPCTKRRCEEPQFRPFWREIALEVIQARWPSAIVLCGNVVKDLWHDLAMPKMKVPVVDGEIPSLRRPTTPDDEEAVVSVYGPQEKRTALAAVVAGYTAARKKILKEYTASASGGHLTTLLSVMQQGKHPQLAAWDEAAAAPQFGGFYTDGLFDGDPDLKIGASASAPAPRDAGADPTPRDAGADPTPRDAGADPAPRDAGADPAPRSAGAESTPTAATVVASPRVPTPRHAEGKTEVIDAPPAVNPLAALMEHAREKQEEKSALKRKITDWEASSKRSRRA